MIEFIRDQCVMDYYPIAGGVRVEAKGRFVEAVELENGLYGIAIHNYFSQVEPRQLRLREKTFLMLHVAMGKLLNGERGIYGADETFYEGEFLKPGAY